MKKLVSKLYGKYASNFGEVAIINFGKTIGKIPQYDLIDKNIHLGDYFMVKIWKTKAGMVPEFSQIPSPNKSERKIWMQAQNLVMNRFTDEKNQMEAELMSFLKKETIGNKEVKR